jgi:hypothetical protein
MGLSQQKTVPYRLIFVDIDGTLIGSSDDRISARTRDALKEAQAAGCHLAICTGRGRYMIERIASQIDALTFAAVFDGASVWDLPNERCLYRVELPAETCRIAADVAIQAGVAPLCYGIEERGFEVHTVPDLAIDDTWRSANVHRIIAGDMTFQNGVLPQLISVYGSAEMVKNVAENWRSRLTDIHVFYGRYSRTSGCWNAYITSASVDKSTAAAAICRLLEIDPKQTLAIGDGENDLPLLRWAGLGVCMGNGHAAAQACASHITASVEEDGVAMAIERFVLGM